MLSKLPFLLAPLVLYIRLRPFSEPPGADGFFYLKQIQSLSQHFLPYYKDFSAAFLFPSLLNVLLRDELQSLLLTSSLLWAGLWWLTFELADLKDLKRKVIFGSVGLLLFSFCLLPVELSLVFLKTGTGLLFLMLGMRSERPAVKLACWLMAILCHKTMLVYLLVILALRFSWKKLLYVVPLAAVGALLYPKLLTHAFHLLGEGAPWVKFFSDRHQGTLYFLFLYFVAAVVLLCQKKRDWFLAVTLLLPILSPGDLSSESAVYRFLVLGFPFLLIALTKMPIIPGGLLTAGLMALTIHTYRPLSTWVVPWGKRVSSTEKIKDVLPERALLFAPHGLEFYLAYKTPLRARSLRIDPRGRPVYRMAYIRPYLKRRDTQLYQDLVMMRLLDTGEEFGLYREEDWLSINEVYQMIPHPMNLLPKKPDFVPEYED